MITLNIKGKMIKLLEESSGENLYDLELGKECLKATSLSWSIKEKLWTSSLFKTSLIQKTLLQGWIGRLPTERQYLQVTHPEYIKNSPD